MVGHRYSKVMEEWRGYYIKKGNGKIRNAYNILVGSQLRKIQLEGRLY
jgi:hypothetical protein